MSEEHKPEKFSWHKFFIKLSCRKLMIWVTYTVIVFIMLSNGQDVELKKILAWGWVVITGLYFIGSCLTKVVLEKIAANTKINIGTPDRQAGGVAGGW